MTTATIDWTPARIRALRRRARQNQEDFAAALGVRRATVSDWENGKKEPGVESLNRLDRLAAIRRIEAKDLR